MALRYKRKHLFQDIDYFHDGIHLDFSLGAGALGCYTKAINGAVTQAALTSIFTFLSGNQSYIMGPSGLLVAAATNTPRIEYDESGNCLGLLMEVARTNLGLHSNDGTNVAWTKSNTTAAKTATGPDGVASSATTVTATAGNGTILQSVVSASAQRTYSIWLKRRTGTGNIDMTVDGGTGWTTKTITSSWARYSITQAAVTNPSFGLRIVTSGNEVDFWCSQLESAPFMSSSIPTTTASVARTADSAIRTLGTEFSATAGTVAVSGRASGGQDALAQGVWAAGVFPDTILFQRPATSDVARYNIFTASTAYGPLDATFANSTAFKAAMAYATNDCALSFNGAAIVSDTSVTLAASHATLSVGSVGAGVTPMNGHIRKFDYWPVRLPNGFLTTY